ncbi:MAG: type III pantothenate kinase [Oscillospiraceae bacterium]|nr:type III pantothenate kinase [Oscillospiraceae bacterium]
MILAVDVGNTNIVLGCIENGEILNIARISTNVSQTAEEYAIKLKDILDIYGIDRGGFEGAILSSVVPPVTGRLQRAIKFVIGLDCMMVGSGMKTGLNICIDEPLAADIVVGSVAAMNYYGTPCIILDMGTATTMVVVDSQNRYLGGAIMPGVKLSYAALSSGASLLPDISITAPKKCIATNTVDSMRSGAVFGTAAMLDGMIDGMEYELGEKCKLVATGGIAQFVTSYCKHEIICDNDLLLKGLWVLYQKNKRA